MFVLKAWDLACRREPKTHLCNT